jgi:hypothetical protein
MDDGAKRVLFSWISDLVPCGPGRLVGYSWERSEKGLGTWLSIASVVACQVSFIVAVRCYLCSGLNAGQKIMFLNLKPRATYSA